MMWNDALRAQFRCLAWGMALAIGLVATTSVAADVPPNDRLLRSLAHALSFGDRARLQQLLMPKNIHRLDPADRVELMKSLIERDYLAALTTAIRSGLDPNLILVIDREGEPLSFTALNHALSVQDDPAIAAKLIDMGADVNLTSIDDSPPLLTTAALGQREMMERLLAKGADANGVDRIIGLTPLMVVLANSTEPDKALILARLLVEHGANIDATATTGHTAMMFAAKARNAKAVEWLTHLGADASKAADDGTTVQTLLEGRPTVHLPGMDSIDITQVKNRSR